MYGKVIFAYNRLVNYRRILQGKSGILNKVIFDIDKRSTAPPKLKKNNSEFYNFGRGKLAYPYDEF